MKKNPALLSISAGISGFAKAELEQLGSLDEVSVRKGESLCRLHSCVIVSVRMCTCRVCISCDLKVESKTNLNEASGVFEAVWCDSSKPERSRYKNTSAQTKNT